MRNKSGGSTSYLWSWDSWGNRKSMEVLSFTWEEKLLSVVVKLSCEVCLGGVDAAVRSPSISWNWEGDLAAVAHLCKWRLQDASLDLLDLLDLLSLLDFLDALVWGDKISNYSWCSDVSPKAFSHVFWSCWRRRFAKEPRNTEAFGVLFRLVPWASLLVYYCIGIDFYCCLMNLYLIPFLDKPHNASQGDGEHFSRERMQANTLHHLSTGRRVPKGPPIGIQAPELSSRSTGSSACSTTCCPATWRRTMAMVAAFTCDESLLSTVWKNLEDGGIHLWNMCFLKVARRIPIVLWNWVILSIFNPFKQ